MLIPNTLVPNPLIPEPCVSEAGKWLAGRRCSRSSATRCVSCSGRAASRTYGSRSSSAAEGRCAGSCMPCAQVTGAMQVRERIVNISHAHREHTNVCRLMTCQRRQGTHLLGGLMAIVFIMMGMLWGCNAPHKQKV